MVVADTSVWVDFLRGKDKPLVARVRQLLDDDSLAITVVTRIELLVGSPGRDRPLLQANLGALLTLTPQPETWRTIEDWLPICAKRGFRFGFADLLIASMAAERGWPVWSLDGDFHRMQEIGLIRCFPYSSSHPAMRSR